MLFYAFLGLIFKVGIVTNYEIQIKLKSERKMKAMRRKLLPSFE
jgi:hypothetical protein